MAASAPLISIIDDDESTRLALASLLKLFGMQPETYASVEMFLRRDGRDASDCIITDIQMPGLSGIDLKRILDARACYTPMIMITGRPEVRLHEQALASGIVCLLNKPFDADALLACLKKLTLFNAPDAFGHEWLVISTRRGYGIRPNDRR